MLITKTTFKVINKEEIQSLCSTSEPVVINLSIPTGVAESADSESLEVVDGDTILGRSSRHISETKLKINKE